jgi:hypothetical protein
LVLLGATARGILPDLHGQAPDGSPLLLPPQLVEETTLYITAEAGIEDLVRMLLRLYDFEGTTVRSQLDLHAFHVAAKQGIQEQNKDLG